jgi:FdhE protein
LSPTSATNLEGWVARHPYLEPLARFTARVEAAAGEIETPRAGLPAWDIYAPDFAEGLALLQSGAPGVDLAPGGTMAVDLVGSLSRSAASGSPIAGIAELDAQLSRLPEAARRVVDSLLGGESFAPASPGLFRFLGWTAMSRYLAPVVGAFALWRAERWSRPYCPTCGSLPAMAQMIGGGPENVRLRLLACGLCGTRWKYARTKCPFCESDAQRLDSVAVEGEGGLRIDYCEKCLGYIKTYDGMGEEAVLLADWTSLHLDFVARDRGLRRLAASLYDLEPALEQQAG